MAEWIYFLHPPRENFAATMTDEERAVWSAHFDRFTRLLADGTIILVGPTLGPINTGISIFEAPGRGDGAAPRRGGSGRRGRVCTGRITPVPCVSAPRPGLKSEPSVARHALAEAP